MLKKSFFFAFFISVVLFLINFFLLGTKDANVVNRADTPPYIKGSFNVPFNPSCKSALFVNLDTGTRIYEKNADDRLPMASLTKIMSAMIVLEKVNNIEGTKVQVKKELIRSLDGTGSSLSGIKIGEELSILQLLHCLLITSGNDAALVLADFVGNGSVEKFVDMMNKKATELGCENTHFTNPHGLDDDEHYSTANDLFIITNYATKNPIFVDITSTVTSKILGESRYPLVTTNSMIDRVRGGKYYYKYTKGIKTGYSSKAGKCLISTASNDNYRYLCIILGGFADNNNNIAMLDSRNMYQWAFENLELKKVASQDTPLGEMRLKLSWGNKKIMANPVNDCTVILPKDILPSSINYDVKIPEYINAPIAEGQHLGVATLSYANTPLAVVDLVSSQSAKRSNILYTVFVVSSFFKSIWFKADLCVFACIFVTYALILLKRKKQKTKNNKKYRNNFKRT